MKLPAFVKIPMPQSIFARTIVLFITMMIISNVASFVIFVIFFTKPLADSAAENVAHHINTIEYALDSMRPLQRKMYLARLVKEKNTYFYSYNDTSKGLPGKPATRFYEKPFEESLKKRLLNPDYRIRFEVDKVFESDKPRIIWVEIKHNDNSLWIGSPLSSLERPFPWNWISYIVFIILLTLIGSFMIARRIKKPLDQLVQAADKLGQGMAPEPVHVSGGPKEILTMANAFNQMAIDVQKLADDRNLMLAGISHDLRTPLARVRLALEMVDQKLEPELYNGMIEDIESIDSIVGQFLTYVRDGVDELATLSDLNAMIEHMAARYAQENKHIKLNLSAVPKFSFKYLAMQRLLTNLINNAWDYGRQDVTVETTQIGDHVYICVLDRGPGIDQQDVNKLTQPFTRKVNSRTDTRGAGLGLAIVERIVSWHNGVLLLNSREGGGLKACVELPLTPDAE